MTGRELGVYCKANGHAFIELSDIFSLNPPFAVPADQAATVTA